MGTDGKAMTLDEVKAAVEKHPHMKLTDMTWFKPHEIEGFLVKLTSAGMVQEMANGNTCVIHDPTFRIWIDEWIKFVHFDPFGEDEDDALGKPCEIWDHNPTNVADQIYEAMIRLLVTEDEQDCYKELDEAEKRWAQERKDLEENMEFHSKYRTKLRGLLKEGPQSGSGDLQESDKKQQ